MATKFITLHPGSSSVPHSGAYSVDGTTWSNIDLPEANTDSGVLWEESIWSPDLRLWCAAGVSNATPAEKTAFATSLDGINWTPRNAAVADSWGPIAWGNGRFVALLSGGSATAIAQTSPDGITWTTRTTTLGVGWIGLIYVPDLALFIAVGPAGAVMTSADGITWHTQTAAEANNWRHVCWSPSLGLLVAVASSGTHRVMTSPNGTTWTVQTAASQNFWRRVAWSPTLGMFVAVSSDNAGGNGQIMTSTNGTAWTPRAAPAVAAWVGLVWSVRLAKFVANANNSQHVMTSTNGTSWTDFSTALPDSRNWFYIQTADTTEGVAISELTTVDRLRTGTTLEIQDPINGSDDETIDDFCYGIDMDTPSQIAASFPSAAGIGPILIAGGQDITVTTTPRLATAKPSLLSSWASQTPAPTTVFVIRSFAYGNGTFVAVGGNSRFGNTPVISTSVDGVNWVSRTPVPASSFQINGVAYGAGVFCAVGETTGSGNAIISTSPDGVTWTQQTSTPVTSTTWNAITYSSTLKLFVAVGNNTAGAGIISTSPDGITWTQRTSVPSASTTWSCVVWDPVNSVFVAGGVGTSTAPVLSTSPDGVTWTQKTFTPSTDFQIVGLAVGGGATVAVGYNGAGTLGKISTSTDNATWVARTPSPATNVNFNGVAYGFGTYVAVGTNVSTNAGIIETSGDGITWTQRTDPNSGLTQYFGVIAGATVESAGTVNTMEVEANTLAARLKLCPDDVNYPAAGFQISRHMFGESNFSFITYTGTTALADNLFCLFAWVFSGGICIPKKITAFMIDGAATSPSAGFCDMKVWRVYGLSTLLDVANVNLPGAANAEKVGSSSLSNAGPGSLSPPLGTSGLVANQPPAQAYITTNTNMTAQGYVDAAPIGVAVGARAAAAGGNPIRGAVLYDWQVAEQPIVLSPGTGLQFTFSHPAGTGSPSQTFLPWVNIDWEEWTMLSPSDR